MRWEPKQINRHHLIQTGHAFIVPIIRKHLGAHTSLGLRYSTLISTTTAALLPRPYTMQEHITNLPVPDHPISTCVAGTHSLPFIRCYHEHASHHSFQSRRSSQPAPRAASNGSSTQLSPPLYTCYTTFLALLCATLASGTMTRTRRTLQLHEIAYSQLTCDVD